MHPNTTYLFMPTPNYSNQVCSFLLSGPPPCCLGLPTFCLPSGYNVKAVLHIMMLSILRTWLIYPHFLFAILSLTFDVPVLRRYSSLEIFSNSKHPFSYLAGLFWNLSSFSLSRSVVFHVSVPYVRTENTKLLYGWKISRSSIFP